MNTCGCRDIMTAGPRYLEDCLGQPRDTGRTWNNAGSASKRQKLRSGSLRVQIHHGRKTRVSGGLPCPSKRHMPDVKGNAGLDIASTGWDQRSKSLRTVLAGRWRIFHPNTLLHIREAVLRAAGTTTSLSPDPENPRDRGTRRFFPRSTRGQSIGFPSSSSCLAGGASAGEAGGCSAAPARGERTFS